MQTSPQSPSYWLQGSEVVLVVEDDTRVRELVCGTLKRYGYHVLEAKDGEHALEVLQEYHGPMHLLVSDMIMPNMGGGPLITMLREWYPNVEVLVISAFSEDLLRATGVRDLERLRYLHKPFTQEALARAVRQVLDGAAPSARGPAS